MSPISGKLIALTGAASGIGRATALLLASRGATLSLADLQQGPLQEVAEDIKALGGKVIIHVTDVTKQAQVDAWITTTVLHFGQPLDGAANLAGVGGKSIMTEPGMVRNLSNEEYDFVMGVNAGGLLNCLRAELNAMKEGTNGKGGGSIVNATSSAGLQGVPMGTPYAASKHAVIAMTRCVAKEEGRRAIRVNAVAP